MLMLVVLLASLKTEVDKCDIVKKTEYNKLVGKVDNIDTTNFVLKTKKMDQMDQI